MNKSKIKKTLAGVFATAILAVGVAVPAGAAFPGYIGSTQYLTLSPGMAAVTAGSYEGKNVEATCKCLASSNSSVRYLLRYSVGSSVITYDSNTRSPGTPEVTIPGHYYKSTFWQYIIAPVSGTNARATGRLTIIS